MFDKEYSFKGTHADKVVKLTAKFDDKNSIFKRNLDVYMMAPIVGFLYQRKAESNNDGEQITTKIFPEQLISDKACRDYNSDRASKDEKLFESYVLGGVDVLYEKIIGNDSSAEAYMSNLYDFMEDMNERYNQTIDANHIEELCKLAKQ